jgi:sarcosine oxidase subunit beta
MAETFDVIIIGAGVHGASLAFHLAVRGAKPLVLEKSFLAAGATGRSSGLVRMHYDLQVEARLAFASLKYFQNWRELVGGDCGFTRTGFLQFVTADQVEALRLNVISQQALGINTALVTSGEVRELAPYLDVDDVVLAAYEPDSGYADPSSTAGSLLSAAKAHGAVFIQACSVQEILVSGGRITGVSTARGVYFAPIVVNAAGPWAKTICDLVNLDLPFDTWRHDTLFIKRPLVSQHAHVTVIDFPNSMYFRPEGNDLTLVGLEDGNPLGVSPDSDTNHTHPGFIEAALDRIYKRFPALEQGHLQSAHSGFDGITPDQHPALGPAGPDGFFIQAGFSGTGFKIAPATGLCMAEWILDGKPTSIDISILSPARFEHGHHLQGDHPYESIWR